ncbi:MAG: transposase [Methylotenera sp.]|nr:transposase [Methylotenera sp.]
MNITQEQKPHQRYLRRGRFSETNQIYHASTTILNSEPIFQYHKNVRLIVNVLKNSDELWHINTLASVIMPDHVHGLFQLNQALSLSSLIQCIK